MMLDSSISESQTAVCVSLVVRELCGMQEPHWKKPNNRTKGGYPQCKNSLV